MPIYELLQDEIRQIAETSFGAAGVRERGDLQRLLRKQIEIVAPDTLVIAEEFGDWEDSKRRIDLLAIDKEANLVVIELKRTEDGGHMDLQALRYAAMISTMTFEQAVAVYADMLKRTNGDVDARASLLDFLEWEEPDEERFAQDVRIVLVAAEFSIELTTTVMWLIERELDIRCMRIKPYNDNGRVLLDVQQVIPLPEAAEYQVKIKEKLERERESRKTSRDLTKYDVTTPAFNGMGLTKRHAILTVAKLANAAGASPEAIAASVPWRKSLFWSLDGTLGSDEFVSQATSVRVNGKKFDPQRYFVEPDELFVSNGRTYAITNQWGGRTFVALQNIVKAFPAANIQCVPSKP